MGSYRGIPYRPPGTAEADTDLGFDPNQVAPLSPDELDSRQHVVDAHQSLQDALAGQQAAGQQHGIGAILSNPIFQTAIPAALTALTAIFPRHMAVAGPTGMAGFRTLQDTNIMQGRMQQAQAADVVRQRQEDFNRQRFKHVLENTDIDPGLKQALSLQADTDVKGAAQALDKASQDSLKANAFNQQTAAFDPHTLQPGEHRTFTGPNGSISFQAPSISTPFEASLFGTPEQKAAGEAYDAAHRPPNEYADFKAKWKIDHPEDKDGLGAAAAYKMLQKDNTQGQNKEVIDKYLDAVQHGTAPIPLPSARGGMTPEMQALIGRADERGINLRHLQEQQLANIQLIKTMNGNQWQGELKNVTTVERMLDNVQKAYEAWVPYSGGARVINSLALQGATQLPGQAGVAATQLHAALTEARRSMGQMLQGGSAITDEAARATQDIMREDMPLPQFAAAIATARSQTSMRKWALLNPEAAMPPAQGEGAAPPPLMPTGKEATSLPVEGAGKYKTQREAEEAYVKGDISKDMFNALARKNGWNRNTRAAKR